MWNTFSIKPDEIRHDVQSTRAKVTLLSQEPVLRDHEDVARALADLQVDLTRAEAVVDRAQPADGTDVMLRLDIAELKDALPHIDPALERPVQSVLTSAAYIERRLMRLDSERAAALRRSVLRRAGVRALLGVAVAAAPFVLIYARKKPLIASAQVLAGCAAVASALLVRAGPI
jgi:hypothetical protein